MLVEIDTDIYDVEGKPVAGVRKRHRIAQPNVPFGRFFSQPLSVRCSSIEDVRAFLRTCRYVSDRRQFGVDDHWNPPENFENTRRGDCEDFALWAWRQLVHLGYECRFVGGSAGFYGSGHAWLTAKIDGRHYLVEPQARWAAKLPRLALLGYCPAFSVEWRDEKPRFYEHKPTGRYEDLRTYIEHGPEWLWYRLRGFGRGLKALALLPVRIARTALERRRERA